MTSLKDLKTQVLQLSDADKWQLLRMLLDELEQNTKTPNPDQKNYPLRDLPVTISEDFDDPS